MLRASDIRIVFAFIASLAVHGMLLGLQTGTHANHTTSSSGNRVIFRLVSHQAAPAPEEVKNTAKKADQEVVRKTKPLQPEVKEKKQPVATPENKKRQQLVPEPENYLSEPVSRAMPQVNDRTPETDVPAQDIQAAEPIFPEKSPAKGLTNVVMARPLYRINPPPQYPARAKRRNLAGTVILEVEVNTAGKVDNLQVKESCGYAILDRAALSAVRKWVFEPGSRNGVPVNMTVLVPVRFALK